MSRLVVLTPESSPARLSTDSIALLASPPRRSCGRWRLLPLFAHAQGTAASRSIGTSRHDEPDKADDSAHALRRKRKLVLSLIALALVIVAISLAVIFTQANGRHTSNGDPENNLGLVHTLAPAAVESFTSTIAPQTSTPPTIEADASPSPASVALPVPEASAAATAPPFTVPTETIVATTSAPAPTTVAPTTIAPTTVAPPTQQTLPSTPSPILTPTDPGAPSPSSISQATPTSTPTLTPNPTPGPAITPTTVPTPPLTPEPSASPTPTPTPPSNPPTTPAPAPSPTAAPTPPSTKAPTPEPTVSPTAAPSSAQGSIRFVNNCGASISLFYTFVTSSGKSDHLIQTVSAGGTFDVVGSSFQSSTFRVGPSSQATLLEVSRNDGKLWYDISVIPPGCGDGLSWDACSRGGTVTGYNMPLSVRPARVVSQAGYNCVDLQCASEQCPDAYLFPSDNIKTKSCSVDEVLVATWC
ncbi:hypothetical protein SDRG_16090 [Saprolegnia diclina VS20]|uniref:Uncharacterized protein n=1 Tax=Saprolegnia diclina (strain VS20) TaxID=1156394 RepID=T0PV02_SAPDV|nr:hypothetical protein SDRG_16090 [Saprolegnia diclina VS20]EQC26071.1 hypothetical protein SDRG_16090 [Saprolegnia diclina VS20]|eukprot:XP_008620508.1 hypothetical protein SDRG_16090 [Saprolegnia diclina VS20]